MMVVSIMSKLSDNARQVYLTMEENSESGITIPALATVTGISRLGIMRAMCELLDGKLVTQHYQKARCLYRLAE